MGLKFTKILAVVAAPLVTLGATEAVTRHVPGLDEDARKAVAAALAALAIYLMTQVTDILPKRVAWWRRRFDDRAAFEGWWIQVHPHMDRMAVFSFLYSDRTDSYSVEGNAFNGRGEHLAHWRSTNVFYAGDDVSYLWSGKSLNDKPSDDNEWLQRSGTTTLSLAKTGSRRDSVTGNGELFHLNQDRVLDFMLRRITLELLRRLTPTLSAMDELADFDNQSALAKAWLARPAADPS